MSKIHRNNNFSVIDLRSLTCHTWDPAIKHVPLIIFIELQFIARYSDCLVCTTPVIVYASCSDMLIFKHQSWAHNNNLHQGLLYHTDHFLKSLSLPLLFLWAEKLCMLITNCQLYFPYEVLVFCSHNQHYWCPRMYSCSGCTVNHWRFREGAITKVLQRAVNRPRARQEFKGKAKKYDA